MTTTSLIQTRIHVWRGTEDMKLRIPDLQAMSSAPNLRDWHFHSLLKALHMPSLMLTGHTLVRSYHYRTIAFATRQQPMLSAACLQLPERLVVEVRNKQHGVRKKTNKHTHPDPHTISGVGLALNFSFLGHHQSSGNLARQRLCCNYPASLRTDSAAWLLLWVLPTRGSK